MSKKILVLAVIILTFIPLAVFAQGLRVNNKEAEEGSTINLFYDDLDAGKINFTLPAANTKKAEITFDRGRTWEEMNKEKDYFTFSHRPLSDEVITPEFLLTSEDGKMNTERPGVKINYQRKNPDEAVLQVLDKMKLYYEQASIDRFMSLFSSSFPNRTKFQEAIQNDFYNYRNMRLHYTIDRKIFDDDLEGAIWDVYWERKGDTRTGGSIDDNATISMRFDKESGVWLISGLRNNTIFGSSLLGGIDLTILSLIVTDGAGPPAYTADVNVAIQNTGNSEATSITVDYYKKRNDGPPDPGFILFNSQSVPSLAAGATLTLPTVTYGALPFLGGNYDFKVIVTATGDINESNNQRTVSHFINP